MRTSQCCAASKAGGTSDAACSTGSIALDAEACRPDCAVVALNGPRWLIDLEAANALHELEFPLQHLRYDSVNVGRPLKLQ